MQSTYALLPEVPGGLQETFSTACFQTAVNCKETDRSPSECWPLQGQGRKDFWMGMSKHLEVYLWWLMVQLLPGPRGALPGHIFLLARCQSHVPLHKC